MRINIFILIARMKSNQQNFRELTGNQLHRFLYCRCEQLFSSFLVGLVLANEKLQNWLEN